MRRIIYILLSCCCYGHFSLAQTPDSSIQGISIEMDEVIVSAIRDGWDVDAFIKRIKTDTTFYKAFRSLRLTNHTATNDIRIRDKKDNTTASLYSITEQTYDGRCRSMKVVEEKTSGKFYKRNGDYRYYTAALYAHLFFTKGKVCNETDIIAGTQEEPGKSRLERSKAQLKQLIFSPGSKISGVPLMGDKASLFEPETSKMYDFRLMSVTYAGEHCYLFRAVPKPQYQKDVVFKDLSTWFRATDYSIMARDYTLSYSTIVYDFDVRMKVRLEPVGSKLLPVRIEYDGNWDIATQPRERTQFITMFEYND